MDTYAAERIFEARKQKVLDSIGTISPSNITAAKNHVQQLITQVLYQVLPTYLSQEELSAHHSFKDWLQKLQQELFGQEAKYNAPPEINTLPSGLRVENRVHSIISNALHTANTVESALSLTNTINSGISLVKPYENPYQDFFSPSIDIQFSALSPVSVIPTHQVIQPYIPPIQFDQPRTVVVEREKIVEKVVEKVTIYTKERVIYIPLPSYSFGYFMTNGQFNWIASLPDLARIAFELQSFDDIVESPRICMQGKLLKDTSFKKDAKYKAFNDKQPRMEDFEMAKQLVFEILRNTDKCSAVLKEIKEVEEGRSDGSMLLTEAIE